MPCEPIDPNKSGKCQAGAVELSSYCRELWQLGDGGCYNPNSRMSGGGPSAHVSGRAVDLMCNWYDTAARARGDACFAWLMGITDQLEQVIWADRIWDCSYGGVRGYSGTDHHNHLHVHMKRAASEQWRRPAPVPPPIPIGESMAACVIYLGVPHSFWISEQGWLMHSWGQGTRENMRDYAAGERYREEAPVAAAVNGRWLNVRAECRDVEGQGRRLMCFDHNPDRKPVWSAYVVLPIG